MIDTLHLTLDDYEIRPRAKLRVQPAPLDVETGEQLPACVLWSTRGGGGVEGVKAYHNGEAMNVSIAPCGRAGADESAPMLRLVGSAPSVNCYVNFSLPKRCAGNNYEAVGLEESREAVRGVERELKEIGIRTNIERARVSRLDAFRNVITDEPFIAYQRVFGVCQAKRMQKRDYGTTFLWHNTQQETCVYDKLAEMAARKVDVLQFPANTMRFEHRLLNGRKVRDALGGVRTIGDLWEGYERVAAMFEKAMRSNLFRFTTEEIEIETGNELARLMQLFYQRGRRYWFDDFLRAYGLATLLERADVETILGAAEKVVLESGLSPVTARTTRHKLGRKLHQTRFDLEIIKPHSEGTLKTIGTLYRELESKVLQPERLAA